MFEEIPSSRTLQPLLIVALLFLLSGCSNSVEGYDTATFGCPAGQSLCEGLCVAESVAACGASCTPCPELVGSSVACSMGQCIHTCEEDLGDANGDLDQADSDGCECSVTDGGEELCDGRDNDCDGEVDEEVGNGCGGCETLLGRPGDTCGLDCPGGAGQWTCLDVNLVVCEGPDVNACGGCGASETIPTQMCGECGVGECQGSEAVCTEQTETYYPDVDMDGQGDVDGAPQILCVPTEPHTATNNTDCDDDEADRFFGADRSCNNADNDCDGFIDEARTCELKQGVCEGSEVKCNPQEGEPDNCDEVYARRSDFEPGLEAACDEQDNNCDGAVDEHCCTPDDMLLLGPEAQMDNHQFAPAIATRPSGDDVLAAWLESPQRDGSGSNLSWVLLNRRGGLQGPRMRFNAVIDVKLAVASNFFHMITHEEGGRDITWRKLSANDGSELDTAKVRGNGSSIKNLALTATTGDRVLLTWTEIFTNNKIHHHHSEIGPDGPPEAEFENFFEQPDTNDVRHVSIAASPDGGSSLIAWEKLDNGSPSEIQWALVPVGGIIEQENINPTVISSVIRSHTRVVKTNQGFALFFFEGEASNAFLNAFRLNDDGTQAGEPTSTNVGVAFSLQTVPVNDNTLGVAWLAVANNETLLTYAQFDTVNGTFGPTKTSLPPLNADADSLALAPGPQEFSTHTGTTHRWFTAIVSSEIDNRMTNVLQWFNGAGDRLCFRE